LTPTTSFDEALSAEQLKIARTVVWDHPHQIRGVAGSGKTTVLARNLAQRLYELDSQHHRPHIAVVCYNRCLKPLIEERTRQFYFDLSARELAPGRVLFTHFNGLLHHLCRSSSTPANPLSYVSTKASTSEQRALEYLQQIQRLPALQMNAHRFDTIYVDEGQDFSENEFRVLLQLMLVSPAGARNLILFYDNAQNLYARKAPNWSSLGISFVGRSDVMKTCVRNPAPVLDVAFNVLVGRQSATKGPTNTLQFADMGTLRTNGLIDETGPVIRTRFAQRTTGATPEVSSFTQSVDEQNWLARHIDHLLAHGTPAEEILVIAPKHATAERFTQALRTMSRQVQKFALPHQHAEKDLSAKRPGYLTVSTPESVKGYDAAVVFVVASHEFTNAEAKDRAAFYVACTRSKEQLFISGIGGMGLLGEAQRVRGHLYPGVPELTLPPLVLTLLETERMERVLSQEISELELQKHEKEKLEMQANCHDFDKLATQLQEQAEFDRREISRLRDIVEYQDLEKAEKIEGVFAQPIAYLEMLLCKLTILPQSYQVLSDPSLDPSKAFTILGEINAGIFDRPSVNVTKGKGWAEVRFSTGISDDGRIYYQKSLGMDGKREVLISLKKRQDQDILVLCKRK